MLQKFKKHKKIVAINGRKTYNTLKLDLKIDEKSAAKLAQAKLILS